MKQTVNFNSFVDAFRAYNRYDQFGYEALRVLFDYLEECEQSCNEELELDVIALCCEYSADTVTDIIEQYNIDIDGETDSDVVFELVMDYLNDNTSICGTYTDGQDRQCIVYAIF